jgi:predicted  nucleic acid-binding Zn-ribbon protein
MASSKTKLMTRISIFTAAFFAANAVAAPLKEKETLPLGEAAIAEAKANLGSDEEAQKFAAFILSLDTYRDHANDKDKREDRNVRKIYHVAPYFQAAEERSVVGAQEIADQGLTIVSEIYDLTQSFDWELFKIFSLRKEVTAKNSALGKMKTNLTTLTDPLAIATTKELVTQIEAEIASMNKQIASLEARAESGVAETSIGLRQQVVNQLQLKLSFLGVTSTAEESTWLSGSNPKDFVRAISSMIARATNEGQFGYRSVIFETGYTPKQRDWIALYKRIRKDVEVQPLVTNTVYARSTALTSKGNGYAAANYFLGSAQKVNAPRLFLAVNGGSDGKCGNTKSCNVTLEYTFLGASMAKTSKSGSVQMPVYFEGDVSFVQPDFEGSVTCDFKTGFKVKGRADVKDGAIIYDGDVTNKINYSSIEEGACSYNIVKGDANSAAYYTIKNIYDTYMRLKTDRAAKSYDEMNRYRDYVNRELAYHAAKSQSGGNRGGSLFDELSTYVGAFGGTWGTVASFVGGQARNFYWHTRIEDSTVESPVKFTTSIKETNVQKSERFTFDGYTIVCWKQEGFDRNMVACPFNDRQKYTEEADTDLGKNQQLCGEEGVSGDCSQKAEDATDSSGTDSNGIVNDPWAT